MHNSEKPLFLLIRGNRLRDFIDLLIIPQSASITEYCATQYGTAYKTIVGYVEPNIGQVRYIYIKTVTLFFVQHISLLYYIYD